MFLLAELSREGGNILADSTGICKLADFGVSSTINSSLGRQRTVIGTPHWSAETAHEQHDSRWNCAVLNTTRQPAQPLAVSLCVVLAVMSVVLRCIVVWCCLLLRMAPEVLLSDEYNELADIWSLGITAYELAVGEPPHAKLHSMRAAVKIPQAAPPTLPDPETWSGDFHSFIAAVLIKDPARRPSAEALLHHPFIARAADPAVLVPMITQREREAGNTHRKASNIGSGDSLDSLDEATSAPLSKPPPAPQQQQPQPPQQQQAQQQAQRHQKVSSSPSDVHPDANTADSQRTQIENSDNIVSTHEHWNNVDDQHTQPTDRERQQQQQQRPHSPLDDNNTRTLPHPLLTAEIDTSPPRRLHRTATTQQQQQQQQQLSQPQRRQQQQHDELIPDPSPDPSQPQQYSEVDGYELHLNAATLRGSSSSPALWQQSFEQLTAPAVAAGQHSSPAAVVGSSAGSSRRHFFPSLPSAAAPSSSSNSTSSPSPSSSSSRSRGDEADNDGSAVAEWSEAGSRLRQYEHTTPWPATAPT